MQNPSLLYRIMWLIYIFSVLANPGNCDISCVPSGIRLESQQSSEEAPARSLFQRHGDQSILEEKHNLCENYYQAIAFINVLLEHIVSFVLLRVSLGKFCGAKHFSENSDCASVNCVSDILSSTGIRVLLPLKFLSQIQKNNLIP